MQNIHKIVYEHSKKPFVTPCMNTTLTRASLKKRVKKSESEVEFNYF